MSAADDVRVQAARRWLTSFPPDTELVGLTAGQLVSLASRMHGAAQLLDAYVRDHEDQAAKAAYIAEHGDDDLETGDLRDPKGDEAAHG